MTRKHADGNRDSDGEAHLNAEEREDVSDRKSGSAVVLHEVIREEGEEELGRPFLSLLLSGFAGGVSISASLMTEGFLQMHLPEAGWSKLVVAFGYTVGFIIVVLGRLQLFTESTVTPVLPVATGPSLGNVARLLRLWAIVFGANIAGTLLVSWAISGAAIVTPEARDGMLIVSRPELAHDWSATFLLAIPAGFLIASIAWILPNARDSAIWVVFVISYVVALGGFSHVVVGSGKAWLLWLSGETSLSHAAFGMILPTLLGNTLGGTGLFAVFAHGQVRHELQGKNGGG